VILRATDYTAQSMSAPERAAAIETPSPRAPGADSTLVSLDGPRVARRDERRSGSPRSAWLIAPLLLAATATGILLVLRGPDRYFGIALGSMLALAVLWILISVLFPARVERTCPSCGRESLRRLDPHTTRGVACDECGFVDPEQSSFLMAEEEGPLESIVMAERRRSRAIIAKESPTRERTTPDRARS
jgi:hypothetical protein